MSHEWTKPYFGVQHYGKSGRASFWATVCDYKGFAEGNLWYPGCQFHPREFIFPDATIARERMKAMVDQNEEGRS